MQRSASSFSTPGGWWFPSASQQSIWATSFCSERAAGIEIRAGLHTGEIEVREDDIGGLAVNIAARVMALTGDGQVWVSATVKDLVVGSGMEFADRGSHVLKGVPGEWRVYEVMSTG
jgi:class 3 adenylate cyclase